jgi:hypothetical protein
MHSSFRQLFDWLQLKIVATESTTMMNGENLHGDVVVCLVKGTQLMHKINIPAYALFGFA